MLELSKIPDKIMYTVEFEDSEGPRIEHVFLTIDEFHKLLDEFNQRRISFSIHRSSDIATQCCHDHNFNVFLNYARSE